jgi:hypothetical protein
MLDDVILGTHRFHLPAPACFVKPTDTPEECEDEINGVARCAMEVELCLPHTTFLNVDDDTVDVEAAMAKKARTVAAKRKKDAEKLAAARCSGKRALKEAANVKTGTARGYGSANAPTNDGGSGSCQNEAQKEAHAGDEMEEEEEEEERVKNKEEEREEGAGVQEDEEGEEEPHGFIAFAIRGIGATAEEKVYVVWNNQDPDDPDICEVSWSPLLLVRNLTEILPNSSQIALKREDLKFGSDLVGRNITGTFKCVDEDGEAVTMDEDGVVTEYDEEASMHVVQWDGGVNVPPSQVGKGDKIKHNLMLTGKTNKTYARGKWECTREILLKWYLDEADEAYPPKADC